MGAGRKVFGCTFGYGVQSWPSKAPNLFTGERVRKSSRKLKLHDNVNIVDVEVDDRNTREEVCGVSRKAEE